MEDVVYSIVEDVKGNLWFGTNDGAVYYDGKSFINYASLSGLSDNIIKCIYEDKKGDVWFGSANGVSKYNGDFLRSIKLNKDYVVMISILLQRIEKVIYGLLQKADYQNLMENILLIILLQMDFPVIICGI